MKTTKDFPVLERSSLALEDMNLLLNGKILVLRIYPFLDSHLTSALSEKLLAHDHQIQSYSMAEDMAVRRFGMTIFEAENHPEKLRKYHRQSRSSGERLRNILFPLSNPLDLLRVRLMEVWSKGIRIESVLGEPMNPGIVRCFDAEDSEGLPPHQDLLSRDLPDNAAAARLKVQLAANAFVKVPDRGGEIDIWEIEPDLEEFHRLKEERYDFLDRNKLPDKFVRLKPREGELMLFRSSCVHAVRPIYASSRIAFSCSVGYLGMGEPLSIWS